MSTTQLRVIFLSGFLAAIGGPSWAQEAVPGGSVARPAPPIILPSRLPSRPSTEALPARAISAAPTAAALDQVSPSALALDINALITRMAQTFEAAIRHDQQQMQIIESLRAQIANLGRQLDEARAAAAPAKKDLQEERP